MVIPIHVRVWRDRSATGNAALVGVVHAVSAVWSSPARVDHQACRSAAHVVCRGAADAVVREAVVSWLGHAELELRETSVVEMHR